MNNNSTIRISIRVTDPWDSTDVITGILSKEVSVDDLKSALIYSANEEWLVLLPRSKGQDLLTELIGGKETVVNIAWLSKEFDSATDHVATKFIATYGSGGAIRLA